MRGPAASDRPGTATRRRSWTTSRSPPPRRARAAAPPEGCPAHALSFPGALLVGAAVALLGCSGSTRGAAPGAPVLHWYANPDNGGQSQLAARCEAASGGRYRIRVSVLPKDATQQREQLVRRLAASDPSIDLMSLDVPFLAEFAEAGFLRPFTDAEAKPLTAGVIEAPLRSAIWKGKLFAAPFTANTQLLWYRKSVASKAGLDPSNGALTWSDVIDAARRTGTWLEVQGNRYEGYMVWINALVASAGGHILEDPESGKDVTPGIGSAAGVKAARIVQQLARSPAADPALSTSDEESGRAAFQAGRAGFMVNWPYVYGAAHEAVRAGTLDAAVLDDIGWARYPSIDRDQIGRPPLGGIHVAVGAFSRHPELAVEAVGCITSTASQIAYMVAAKSPAARRAAYDDPEVRRVFPMADLVRQSIDEAAPRPQTPYYGDVSTSVVRIFHPPTSVRPDVTPADAARLIVDVLHDRVLL